MELPEWIEQILAWASVALVVTTAVHGALAAGLPRLQSWAADTETTADDAVVRWLARLCFWMGFALEGVRILLPRIALGWSHDRRKKPPPLPSTTALVITMLCVPLVAGCGASAHDTVQRALSSAAVGVQGADEIVAAEFRRVRGTTTTADALERASAPLFRVQAAVSVAAGSLRAAQKGLDASLEGATQDWATMAACILGGLADLVAALSAAGLDPPDELIQSVHLIAGLADGRCGNG